MLLIANNQPISEISKKLNATTGFFRAEVSSPLCLSPTAIEARVNRSTAINRISTSIRAIVQQSLNGGYLSIDAEQKLRLLLQTTKYGREDLKAFMRLQQAVMEGQIVQESRERLNSSPKH